MDLAITTFILSTVGAGCGAYFGSYLKRKGENLATHEDIAKLVDQVSAVTFATKQIEATFSNDVWDRQKRWEITRDSLIALIRDIEVATDRVHNLFCAYEAAARSETPGAPQWVKCETEAIDSWNLAQTNLANSIAVAELIGSETVREIVQALNLDIHLAATGILQGKTQAWSAYLPSIVGKKTSLRAAIRKDLRIESSPSESRQSSTTPDSEGL